MASTSSTCNGPLNKKKERTLDNMFVTLKPQGMDNKATTSTSSSSATTNTDTSYHVDMVTLHYVKLHQATTEIGETETDAYVFDIESLTSEINCQNELIHICGQQIVSPILLRCDKFPFYSVLVDGTTDVSVEVQVSCILLFLDDDDGKRHEEFICFKESTDTTAETLYNLICTKLKQWGLDNRSFALDLTVLRICVGNLGVYKPDL